MTDQYEPQRLFESPEAPPELRELLLRAHEDLPSLAERALLIKAATGAADMARTTLVGARGLRWATRVARHSTKLWAVAAVGVGVGALYSAGVLPRHSAQAPHAQVPQVQVSPSQAPQLQVPQVQPLQVQDSADQPPVQEERRPGSDEEPRSSGGLAARPATTRELHTGPSAHSYSRAHAHRAASTPSDAAGARLRSVEDGRASLHSPPASGRLTGDRSDTPALEARPVDAQDNSAARAEIEARGNSPSPEIRHVTGAEEASLLRSARQSLARSPERTLSLTDEHLRRYPHGILDQEREALAIEALMELGRYDVARTRARAFQRAYPESPYRARIQHALARAAADPGTRP